MGNLHFFPLTICNSFKNAENKKIITQRCYLSFKENFSIFLNVRHRAYSRKNKEKQSWGGVIPAISGEISYASKQKEA